MEHTKGPWKSINHWITDETELETIAYMTIIPEGYRIKNESIINKANARLITSAPDLLTVAKGCLAALSQNKVFPADIEYCKKHLANVIRQAEGGE